MKTPDSEPENPNEKQEGFPIDPAGSSVTPEEKPRERTSGRRRVGVTLETLPSTLPESDQMVRFSRATHILLMGYRRWQAKQAHKTEEQDTGESDDAYNVHSAIYRMSVVPVTTRPKATSRRLTPN